MKLNTRIPFLLALLILFASCATKKKKKGEDVSAVGKVYHNTTAKYNGYFNADLLYKETISDLSLGHQDNFNQIIPLYPEVANTDVKASEAKMDEAIKKLSTVITLHRVSQWTDDSYLLIGKCQYAKQDFASAEETFQYLNAEFSPEMLEAKKKGSKSKKKKKKKTKKSKEEVSMVSSEEEKPENYFLKHKPAHEEGQVWLARTMIELEQFDDAALLLSTMDRDPKTHKSVKNDIAEAIAYNYLKQREYSSALAPLEMAIELSNKRKRKARYSYIIAQIHQKMGDSEKAYASFDRVLKYGPTYDMEFSTRLNMAQNAWKSGKGDSIAAIKSLEKMLKDAKNKEYKDQVYFALAKINLAENNAAEAIKNLKASLANNVKNKAQKAESYVTLANLYYKGDDFVNAKNYYDSTLVVLPKTDERFDEASLRANNLSEISKHIQTITLQDSLIAISKLSPEEQTDLALNIKKEADKKDAAKLKGPQAVKSGGLLNPLDAKNSSFFAYNQRDVRRGKKDFIKRWGNRALEDHWRRSNKRTKSATGEEISETTVGDKAISDKEIAAILKDVPNTPAKLKKAESKIADAMLPLGMLFKDKLGNLAKSIETLEAYTKRFPKHPKQLDALYYLYQSNKEIRNSTKASTYANRIIKEYPNSKYAKFLSDPNYAKTLEGKNLKITDYYDTTYATFKNGDYKNANTRIEKASSLFGINHKLQPKFALLSALCAGQMQGKEAYIKSLKEVVARHGKTEEGIRAKQILKYLKVETASATLTKPAKDKKPSASSYTFEAKKSHYFLILLKEKSLEMNTFKKSIRTYNAENFADKNLRASSIFLGEGKDRMPLLVIRRFRSKADAMPYYNAIVNNMEDLLGKKIKTEVYPVSQGNYRKILKSKKLDGYDQFFKENYLK